MAQKFNRLAAPYAGAPLRREIIDAVANIEALPVADRMRLLAGVRSPAS